jgi:hypothetical protein
VSDPFLAIGMAGEASKLNEFDATVAMAEWAKTWARLVTSELRDEAPVGQDDDAGRLRDSIGPPELELSPGRVAMTWSTDVEYAPFVIEGTQPHPIYPKNARALHWDDVFALHVNHPGTQANPFPQRAIDRLLPEMTSSLAALFKEI